MLDLLTLPYSRVRWSALLRQMFAADVTPDRVKLPPRFLRCPGDKSP